MNTTYQNLTDARKILGIPEQATIKTIKSRYRDLLKKWHPDTCPEDQQTCHEMTQKIVAAYKEIMTYCDQYRISFAYQDVTEYLSNEEWWFERFGNDLFWRNPQSSL